MSWFVLDPAIEGDKTGSPPWHILSAESFIIKDRRQMIIHGILRNEGVLILKGSAQLVIKN